MSNDKNTSATSNGVTKNVATVTKPDETNTEVKATAKPELSNYVVEAAKPKPIQERLTRFQELELLKEKRDEIEGALNQLDKFQISPTGSANLKLSDGKNNTFAIAHPSVIGEMVALAKSKLKAELDRIDEQFIL